MVCNVKVISWGSTERLARVRHDFGLNLAEPFMEIGFHLVLKGAGNEEGDGLGRRKWGPRRSG